MARVFGLRLGQARRAVGMRFIASGIVATAVGMGAVTTAAAQYVVVPGGPATRPPLSAPTEPTHPIAGTAHRVYVAGEAAFLNKLIAPIQAFIASGNCNFQAWNEVSRSLERYVNKRERLDISDVFMNTQREDHDKNVAEALLNELHRQFWANCEVGAGVQVSATGGAGNVKAPPTSFFGLRNPVTLFEIRGLINPNANNFVETAGGGFRVDLTNVVRLPGMPGGPSLEFAYNHTRGNRNEFFSAIDPLGQTFLIEGTGDPTAPFPAGVALGAGVPLGTPGGFNVVTGIVYDRTYRSDALNFVIEQPILQVGRILFSAMAGVNVSRTTVDENLNFSIPGFLTNGAYHTNLDFFTYAPNVGGGVSVAVGDIVPGRQTVIYGKAAVGPAITSADLTDRLNLRGFINTNQVINRSDNHTGFYGAFTGGLRIEVGDFFGDGSVMHVTSESLGNVVRTGQVGDISRINFVKGDATMVKFTVGAKFGGGVRVPVTDIRR